MLTLKNCRHRNIALLASALVAIQPTTARSASESDRLEKLERAVELLEKQNAELKAEVNSLKSKQAANPSDAKFKTKVTFDGKRTRRKRWSRRNRRFTSSSVDLN